MGKTNFQYDESGNTFYYFLLTFLSFILFPSTYYFWPEEEKVGEIQHWWIRKHWPGLSPLS